MPVDADRGRESVVAALSRPDFYPERPDRVEVLETHISWIFLAGGRAYKLKKPLVLPFLDYGTAERRRTMCHEEVRLNRRLAPDVYLGVRAIARGTGGWELALERDPRAADYVVEMRRYDQDATLAARLERGELRREEVEAVARALARFHAQAHPVAARGAPVMAVERRMAENFHELLAIVEQRAEIDWVLELERFAHAFAMAHATLLDARARNAFIREVHGDLRAEHVLLGDEPQVVDCIEFDRALRELDVADDLALLVMDLVARGAEPLARTLIRAYRTAGGDPGDDRLIAFYAAYRALVRAKVALLRAAQHPASASAHGRESAAARDLLSLAERFVWEARLPLVIAICGASGADTSALASALAELSHLPPISSAVTRQRIAGLAPGWRVGRGVDLDGLVYAELGRRAASETRRSGGALVEAGFRHRADREAFAHAFRDAAPVLFVECRAPIGHQESPDSEPLDEVPPEAHVVLRSDRPVEALVADLRALLDRRLGLLAASTVRSTDAGA